MIKLSVVIPTRNRAKTLYKALVSICKQTLSNNLYEVIIIDNGSSDNTREIVNSFSKKINNISYIYDDNPGLHIGRHRGLLASQADILVYGDDDIEAFPSWLEGVLESFDDSKAVLVGGKNMPNFQSKPPNWILDLWRSNGDLRVIDSLSILDYGDAIKEIDPFYVFGCNFSILKSVLLEAGGFHPDGMPCNLIKYRGDGESYVSKFIMDKGYKAVYNPKASVYHLCSSERMTKEYFIKRAYSQGISDSYSDIRYGINKSLLRRKLKYLISKYLLFKDTDIEKGYLSGYHFHHKESLRDKTLLDWIRRSSYINDGLIN